MSFIDNKKIKQSGRLFLFTLFIAFNINGRTCYAGENKVDTAKVRRYIDEAGAIYRENPILFDWDTALDKKYQDLVKEINLNEEETLELERIISEEIDLKKYMDFFNMKKDEMNIDHYAKLHVYIFAGLELIDKWKKTLSPKEIILNKMVPLIKNSKDVLKEGWVYRLNDFIRDIPPTDLTYSNEVHAQVMDELINIFKNKKYTVDVRIGTAKMWAPMEKRIEKKYEGFSILLKDEDVFEKTGDSLRSLNKADSRVPDIYEKMFDILEYREKYSEKNCERSV